MLRRQRTCEIASGAAGPHRCETASGAAGPHRCVCIVCYARPPRSLVPCLGTSRVYWLQLILLWPPSVKGTAGHGHAQGVGRLGCTTPPLME
jgi:hypothetical protein